MAAVTCFDVLNHCLTPEDLKAVLGTAWEALRPGGYFLFDLNTQACFASPIWNFENRELAGEGYQMILNGHFDPHTGQAFNKTHLTLETPTGPQSTTQTLVCQYHPDEQVIPLLEALGFTDIEQTPYSPMDLSQVIPGLLATKSRWQCLKPL